MQTSGESLAERIRGSMGQLTKAERRVAHVLMANNLVTGLETVAVVAERAKVSGPTVLRFVAKQGFGGYPEFQQALRAELSERVSSPANLYQRGRNARIPYASASLQSTLATFSEGLHATFRAEQAAEVTAAAKLLADPSRTVWLVGGRFSHSVAEILWAHLIQMRAKVHLVPPILSRRQEALLDVRRDHVVLALDFRRYQGDTIAFATIAAERKARVVLVTDRWLSPISKHADHIVTCDIEAPSPYDSLVSPLALIELLIASLTELSGSAGRRRIEALESLRTEFDRLAFAAPAGDEPAT